MSRNKCSFFSVKVMELDLLIEKPSRPDILFIRKHGPEIHMAMHESLELTNNRVENIESTYTTLALLAVELAGEETVLEMLRLVIGLQDLALTSVKINIAIKFNLHALSISLLSLISYVCNITSLVEHTNKVRKILLIIQFYNLSRF